MMRNHRNAALAIYNITSIQAQVCILKYASLLEYYYTANYILLQNYCHQTLCESHLVCTAGTTQILESGQHN